MNTKVDELIASLPQEFGREETAEQAMADLLRSLAKRKVPTGRLLRLWSLGTLQAKIAAGYFAFWLRKHFVGEEEKERLKNDAHLDAALRLLGGMGYLRGMIAKVGQALATWPDILPEPFVEALGSLHFQAPPMHYSLLREFLTDELGGDPSEVFAEFDTEPFAAASLGQVHAARLHSGEEVAVKVQYPGIARAIDADMKNLEALIAPMRFRRDFRYIAEQVADIRRTITIESDYLREHEYGDHARAALGEDGEFVVPRVYAEHSTRRVLTMERLHGLHLDEFLANDPDQASRDRFGALYLRASCRLMYSGRMTYADASPGNFLMLDDGRLGVIDFGCCRILTDEEWAYVLQAVRAMGGTDEDLREACLAGDIIDGDEPDDAPIMVFFREVCEWLWEPLLTDAEFHVDDAYMKRGIELLADSARRGTVRYMPITIWMNRLFYGTRAFLYRLGARVNLKRIHDEELVRAGLPPTGRAVP